MAEPLRHDPTLSLSDLPTALPPAEESSPLLDYAAQVGTIAGRAVAMFRQAGERVADLAPGISNPGEITEMASAKITDMSAKITDMKDRALSGAEDLRDSASEHAREWARQAKHTYYRTRLRANETMNEYPVHVVLAAGAIGLLLGIGLRIWRANRAY